jgi:undecaprenyl diphosphate synthase
MHLAVIMDGNRRWAKQNVMQTVMGHDNGAETLYRLLSLCPKYGIKTLTVYGLSTENFLNRSKEEIEGIFNVMLTKFEKYAQILKSNNIRIKPMGDWQAFPEKVREVAQQIMELTKENTGELLQVCVNYGGRQEITKAVNRILDRSEKVISNILLEDIDQSLDSNLEPDLVVRTGGQQRLSNFLLWQASYSELYFTPVLWPDFDEKELVKALDFFKDQKRNFGK